MRTARQPPRTDSRTLKLMASVCASGILAGSAPAWASGEELELEWEGLVALRAVRMARGISKAVDDDLEAEGKADEAQRAHPEVARLLVADALVGCPGNEDLQTLHESITASASEDPAIPEPDRPWNLQMLIDRLSQCDMEARATVRGGLNPGSFHPYAPSPGGSVAFWGHAADPVTVLEFLRLAAECAAGLSGSYEAALVWYDQPRGYGRIGVVGLRVEANGDVAIQTKDFG